MLMIFIFNLGCVNPPPQSDADCVSYYDPCNSGCELLCGTVYEKEAVDNARSCDLGCIDSEEDPECIFVEEECLFE